MKIIHVLNDPTRNLSMNELWNKILIDFNNTACIIATLNLGINRNGIELTNEDFERVKLVEKHSYAVLSAYYDENMNSNVLMLYDLHHREQINYNIERYNYDGDLHDLYEKHFTLKVKFNDVYNFIGGVYKSHHLPPLKHWKEPLSKEFGSSGDLKRFKFTTTSSFVVTLCLVKKNYHVVE